MYRESERLKSLCSSGDDLNYDLNQLQNELNVIKPMINDEKLKSIIELYEKLRAFVTVMSVFTGALILPVS